MSKKKLKKKIKKLKKENKILYYKNRKLNILLQEYYFNKYPDLYSYLADIIENRNLNRSDNSLIVKQSKDGRLSVKPGKKG